MPPHCDTMDGPVVTAAKEALEKADIKIILPWATKSAEIEIKKAFDKTIFVRNLSKEAKEVADIWFFETVVRLHRAGEGAPYTGLKPAGLSVGPVIPLIEESIEKNDIIKVIKFLQHEIEHQIKERFKDLLSKKEYDKNDVDSAREYVEAFLGLTLYSHHLYEFINKSEHHEGVEESHNHEHKH